MDAPSRASQKMYLSLAESLNAELTKKISVSRNVDEARVMSWIKKSYHKAPEALESGLVDRVAYEENVEENIKTNQKLEDFISYRDYLSASSDLDEKDKAEGEEKIALIEALGD